MISINFNLDKFNELLKLYGLAVDEVVSDLAVLNHYSKKWPDDYKQMVNNLSNYGERLWNLVPANSPEQTQLAVKINRLDLVVTRARSVGLI